MQGQPFAGSGFADKTGYYLGSDQEGRMIAIDPFIKSADRTNSNFAIVRSIWWRKILCSKKAIT